jgi:hypothetical protein
MRLKMENEDFKNMILKLALQKAFEAGRLRGRGEKWVYGEPAEETKEPDFPTWYRKEMKLDKTASG